MRYLVRCPAKINTFLSVGDLDHRGYHPIRTVIQAVDLYDELSIAVTSHDTNIEFSDATIPETNTISRALHLTNEYAPIPHLTISVEKRIPSEAGLGGGSSNAAGLLRVLQILQPALNDQTIQEIAGAVGMDVPFFLIGGRARAIGYGEVVSPLPDQETRWLVVAKPTAGCSTAHAYKALDEVEREFRDITNDDEAYNDFERVAPCESLDLIEFLKSRGATQAGLSGSGSAVFGYMKNELDAKTLASDLEKSPGVWSRAVRTITRAESLEIASGD